MSAESNETATVDLPLLDDLILNENDLNEDAKSRFPYHTDILNGFKTYRSRILADENLSRMNRHLLFFRLRNNYTNFKQVLNYMAENNELLSRDLPTIGPVIICGLPRTGTTLLYNLLACDPHSRAPSSVEMNKGSVPPIAQSNSIEQKQRAAALGSLKKEFMGYTNTTENNFQLCHPAYSIEEDYLILTQASYSVLISPLILDHQCEFDVYLSDEMMKDFAYDYHETYLRMLNSVDAPRSHWVLKSPLHLLHLDTLRQHYPNAAMIMTHRSMNEVLPSFYNLMCSYGDIYSINIKSSPARKALMAQCTQLFDKMVECILDFRTQKLEKNILDIIYDDLMDRPILTVRRIYDRFGLKWSDEFEIAMQSWLRDNPQGKCGRHTYSLADFGLTQEDVAARYADYIKLFLRPSASGKTQCNQCPETNKSIENV